MSETDLPTGRDSLEQEIGGRQPLPEWNPTPDEPKEYSRGDAGIVDAANDQTQSRGSTEDPLVELIDKRKPKPGQREFYTSAEEAGRDLSDYHKAEAISELAPQLADVAAEVDYARAVNAGAIPQNAQQAAHAEAPPAQPDAPQPEIGEQPSGLSPKLQQALQDPELRAAYEAPYQAAEQTRQAYTAAVSQVADVALSSVLANFPELQGVSGAQLPTVLAFIQKQDPVKAQAIQNQLQQVNAVYSAAQQAKAQQAQMAYAEFTQYAKQQDAAFDNANRNESPETLRAAAKEIVDFAKSSGISQEGMAQLWATNPVLRAAPFQQLMLDAAKYRMAQRTATANPVRNIPHVMKPGVAPSPGERHAVDLGDLRNEFRKATGNDQIRAAVKLQQAQRRARG